MGDLIIRQFTVICNVTVSFSITLKMIELVQICENMLVMNGHLIMYFTVKQFEVVIIYKFLCYRFTLLVQL